MGKSKIGWTEHTVNPLRAMDVETAREGHWCEKISPGCANCYASGMQMPVFKMHEFVKSNRSKVQLFLSDAVLENVVRRKKPTVYFWCSMTDMFLLDYRDEWLDKCFAAMYEASQHTHIVLTKRPEVAATYFANNARRTKIATAAWKAHVARHPEKKPTFMQGDVVKHICANWPLPNVVLGVSVENNEYRHRIDTLAGIPAAYRLVSAEPLLGELDLSDYLSIRPNGEGGWTKCYQPRCIDWVIDGGESNSAKGFPHKERLAQVPWFRLLRDQCFAAGVPYFHKQNGEWVCPESSLVTPDNNRHHATWAGGTQYFRVGKKLAGNVLDGVIHEDFPDWTHGISEDD